MGRAVGTVSSFPALLAGRKDFLPFSNCLKSLPPGEKQKLKWEFWGVYEITGSTVTSHTQEGGGVSDKGVRIMGGRTRGEKRWGRWEICFFSTGWLGEEWKEAAALGGGTTKRRTQTWGCQGKSMGSGGLGLLVYRWNRGKSLKRSEERERSHGVGWAFGGCCME